MIRGEGSLTRRTPLRRDTPKARAFAAKRSYGLRWRSKGGKQRSTTAEWHRSRQWTFDRAGGRCEARVVEECTGRAEHAHHIRLRSRGGSDDPSNLMATCHECHSWIHAHPAEATRRGWMRSAFEENDCG